MSLAEQLIRPGLKQLVPYASARRIGGSGEIWLNANESPFDNSGSGYNRYPEFQPEAVVNAYADYAHVAPEQVLCSRGADEGIELLIRTFCEPGQDKLIYCPPTYGMYRISAETNLVDALAVPLDENYQPNVEAILKQRDALKLVFICSPNNPTGHEAERNRLRKLLQGLAQTALVVVDEAYLEFADQAPISTWLNEFPNLVILRTLSKAFALAGIRCGFTLANADIISALSKVIAPYPVPAPVAEIAAKQLSSAGQAQMHSQVEQLRQQRQQLQDWLRQRDFSVFSSAGNYVLMRVTDAGGLMQFAATQGIVLRDQSRQHGLDGCVRITLGSAAEMQRIYAMLQAFSELETNSDTIQEAQGK